MCPCILVCCVLFVLASFETVMPIFLKTFGDFPNSLEVDGAEA